MPPRHVDRWESLGAIRSEEEVGTRDSGETPPGPPSRSGSGGVALSPSQSRGFFSRFRGEVLRVGCDHALKCSGAGKRGYQPGDLTAASRRLPRQPRDPEGLSRDLRVRGGRWGLGLQIALTGGGSGAAGVHFRDSLHREDAQTTQARRAVGQVRRAHPASVGHGRVGVGMVLPKRRPYVQGRRGPCVSAIRGFHRRFCAPKSQSFR